MKWIAFTKPGCCFKTDMSLKYYHFRELILIAQGYGRTGGPAWIPEAGPWKPVFKLFTENQGPLTHNFILRRDEKF